MKLMSIHRLVSICIVVFVAYLSLTGSLIETIDLKGLLSHAPASDDNLQAMRGDPNGPGEYAVIGPVDYDAAPLPAPGQLPPLLGTALSGVRAKAGPVPMRYIELRMANGRAEGIAELNDQSPPSAPPGKGPPPKGRFGMRPPQHTHIVVDASTGAVLPNAVVPIHNVEKGSALRVQVKSLHRMTTFGTGALWINIFVGTGLGTLIVTGLWFYAKQWGARRTGGRSGLFWKGGGWWRTLHRVFSTIAGIFITIIVLSGLWLAVESLVFGYYLDGQMAQAHATGRPPAMFHDPMGTVPDADVPAMLNTTLQAFAHDRPGQSPRVVRLRVFAGFEQGVVVSGDPEAQQLVYNARTGAPMLETEPGYPETGFPFGWQAHQWAKRVHNGSIVGMTGRWTNLLAGLALFYLAISGIIMYVDLYRRRSRNGKKGLIWFSNKDAGPAKATSVVRQWMQVKVVAKTREATDIFSFELADPRGRNLPPFSAGAHVGVELGGGLIRQYSLCNHPDERHRYLIAVLKVQDSRGGSIAMHERVHQGNLIRISEPKNHFPLEASTRKTLLFAGGIGITPILCMAERLAQTGADFTLHYCGRSAERMAFVDRIKASPFAGRVQFHIDDGGSASKLDITAAIGETGSVGPQDGVQIYVCGPTGFMNWVLQTARDNGWPEEQLHREYFGAAPQSSAAENTAFEVQLASSGKTYAVPADLPITKALRQHGIEVPVSCEEGVCGTCVTRVLEGVPDHRDLFLSPREKARNDQMTLCCSRSKTPKLILDL